MAIEWTAELDTGIEVIDEQHRRIVDYINQLEVAIESRERRIIGQVLDELVGYTVSHFTFEEELQQAATYKLADIHTSVHAIFIRRIGKYRARYDAGEDVSRQLHEMLKNWLVHHIKRDDAAYVSAVKANITALVGEKEDSSWLRRTLKAIFDTPSR